MSLGVIILAHERLRHVTALARYLAEKDVEVVVHVDTSTNDPDMALLEALASETGKLRFAPRLRTKWGSFNLIRATQTAAEMLLDLPNPPNHIALISGACLPIRPIEEFIAYLAAHPERDLIQSFEDGPQSWIKSGLTVERLTLYFPVNYQRHPKIFDALVGLQRKLGIKRRLPQGLEIKFGSQWWCLTAQTLRAILNDPRRAEYDRFFERCWIPDECYFQMLAPLHSRDLDRRTPMLTGFDHYGQPYILYDDHRSALEKSGYFFARKASKDAEGLYKHFLNPDRPASEISDFVPLSIQNIMGMVGWRRRRRRGLISQGRYPHWPRESAVRWLLIAGADGLTEGLRLDQGDWQGALYDDPMADGDHFTGVLPRSVEMRDYMGPDYLTALLWNTRPRLQGLQCCPSDHWYIAGYGADDPQCRLIALRGGWKLRVFSEAARIEAMSPAKRRAWLVQIQKTEAAFLDRISSPDHQTRCVILDLEDVQARPGLLCETISAITGHEATLPEESAMPDLSPITPLLNEAREAAQAGVKALS
ncbi:beta-1,6-N-acetylglucosaminyltransferase [Paracoccaceae bacterium GXU_MW_L88]